MTQIVRLTTRHERTERELAAQLADQMRHLPPELVAQLPHDMREARSRLLHRLDRQASPDSEEGIWPGGFTMISREQTAYVWDRIRELPSTARPNQVRHAFDLVLLNLRWDTGEVMLTRDEFSERIGCSADHVSHLMATLEGMNVIRRERHRIEGIRGRGKVVYFLNPHVAWKGTLPARQEEATHHTPPLLTLMQGGQGDTAHDGQPHQPAGPPFRGA